MLRSFLPLFLCALAGPAAAQIGSVSGGTPVKGGIQAPESAKPLAPVRPAGGVSSATPKQPSAPSDAYQQVLLLRAKFEAAKASGLVCPERAAHQEARLKELEAKYGPKPAPVRPPGGIRSIQDK